MLDLSFARKAANDRMQINDALGIPPGAPPMAGMPVPGQPQGPLAAAAGAQPHPLAAMPALGALQAANPGQPMPPPPGGPMGPLGVQPGPQAGMAAMTQSRGPIFQVNPSQQTGPQPAPRLFARGGRVSFAVRT